MVFCITEERKNILKTLLEDLSKYFFDMEDVSGLFINPYYVHKLMGLT